MRVLFYSTHLHRSSPPPHSHTRKLSITPRHPLISSVWWCGCMYGSVCCLGGLLKGALFTQVEVSCVCVCVCVCVCAVWGLGCRVVRCDDGASVDVAGRCVRGVRRVVMCVHGWGTTRWAILGMNKTEALRSLSTTDKAPKFTNKSNTLKKCQMRLTRETKTAVDTTQCAECFQIVP